jgi:hypothetical protein
LWQAEHSFLKVATGVNGFAGAAMLAAGAAADAAATTVPSGAAARPPPAAIKLTESRQATKTMQVFVLEFENVIGFPRLWDLNA